MYRPLILAGTLILAEAWAGVLETRDGKVFTGTIQFVAPGTLRVAGGAAVPLANLRRAIFGETAPRLVRLENMKGTFYPGAWETLPDFSKLKPASTHTLSGGRLTLQPYHTRTGYALVIEGSLALPSSGVHQFNLGCDDGARLLINGKTVIDNDGRHGLRYRQGKIELRPGRHAFRLEYFNATDAAILSLEITPPGLPKINLTGLAPTSPSFSGLAIPGPGVLLWNGTFIARPITGWTDARVNFADNPPSLRLSTVNTAAIFYQGLPAARLQPFRAGQPAILQRGGKYMEGKIEPGEKGTFTVHSVLLGRRTLTGGSGVTAVLLQKPSKAVVGFHLRTRDGTIAVVQKPVFDKDALILNEPPFDQHRIPIADLLEIRHGSPNNPLQAVWEHFRALNETGRNQLRSQAGALENAAYIAAQARIRHATLQNTLAEASQVLAATENIEATALAARTKFEQAALKARDIRNIATIAHEAAQADLSVKIADRETTLSPALPALKKHLLARVHDRKKNTEKFHPLKLISSTGPEGLEFIEQADGSLLTKGSQPKAVTYTLEFKTTLKTLTGIRLEVLPDPSLKNQGPGHAGKFAVHDVRLYATDQAKLDPTLHRIHLAGARADFAHKSYPARNTIDLKTGAGDKATSWSISSQTGKPHQLILNTAVPVAFQGEGTLRIELDQLYGKEHHLDRFRLTARTDKSPEDDGVTKDLLAILTTEPHKRTSTHQAAVLTYFRQLHPGVKFTGDPANLPPPPDTEAITTAKAATAEAIKKSSADLAAMEKKWAADLKQTEATAKKLADTADTEKTNTVTAAAARLTAAITLAAAKKHHAGTTARVTTLSSGVTTTQNLVNSRKTTATQANTTLANAKRDHDNKKNLATAALKAYQQVITGKQKPAMDALAKARRELQAAEDALNASNKSHSELTAKASEAKALHQMAQSNASSLAKATDSASKKYNTAEANRKKDEAASTDSHKKTEAARAALLTAVTARQILALNAWKISTNTLATAEATLAKLLAEKQKPAKEKAATATKAVTDATNAKAASDKALSTANAAVKSAQDAFAKAEKAAKDDANNADKKKAAVAAKTALDKLITEQQKPAQTKATTAAKALTDAQAAKVETDKALAAINAEVTKAATASKTAQVSQTKTEATLKSANAEVKQLSDVFQKSELTLEAAEKKTAESTAIAAAQQADMNLAKQLADAANDRATQRKTTYDTLATKTVPAAKTKADASKTALSKAQSTLNTTTQAVTRANSDVVTANNKRQQTSQTWEQARQAMETAQTKANQAKLAQTEANKKLAEAQKQLAAAKTVLIRDDQAMKTAETALKSAEATNTSQLNKAAEAHAAVILSAASRKLLQQLADSEIKAAIATIARIQTDLATALKSLTADTIEADKVAETAMNELKKHETTLTAAQDKARAAMAQLEANRTTYTEALKSLSASAQKLAQARVATTTARTATTNARQALDQFQLSNRQALDLR